VVGAGSLEFWWAVHVGGLASLQLILGCETQLWWVAPLTLRVGFYRSGPSGPRFGSNSVSSGRLLYGSGVVGAGPLEFWWAVHVGGLVSLRLIWRVKLNLRGQTGSKGVP
jgi:hypothetical protein